jgi:hypothetical protein
MMQIIDRQALGFASWLALYAFLAEQGYGDHESVRLTKPLPPPPLSAQFDPDPVLHDSHLEVEVVLRDLRALAFEELYAALPTRETMTVLQEIAQEAALQTPEARHLITYLKKQPTRT